MPSHSNLRQGPPEDNSDSGLQFGNPELDQHAEFQVGPQASFEPQAHQNLAKLEQRLLHLIPGEKRAVLHVFNDFTFSTSPEQDCLMSFRRELDGNYTVWNGKPSRNGTRIEIDPTEYRHIVGHVLIKEGDAFLVGPSKQPGNRIELLQDGSRPVFDPLLKQIANLAVGEHLVIGRSMHITRLMEVQGELLPCKFSEHVSRKHCTITRVEDATTSTGERRKIFQLFDGAAGPQLLWAESPDGELRPIEREMTLAPGSKIRIGSPTGLSLEIPDPLSGWDASQVIRGEVSLERSISEHEQSIGHRDVSLKSVTFRRPGDLDRSVLRVLPEQAQLLGVHISRGLGLIRAGNYDAAVSHFSRAEILETCGFSLGKGNHFHRSLDEITGKDLTELITEVAMHSWFMHGSRTVLPSFATVEKNSGQLTDRERKNLAEFNRELCLIYAEEWTHAFQHAMGILVSQKGELIQHLPQEFSANYIEFDVAEFMSEQQIPLSKLFMERYGRDQVHEMLRNYATKAEQNEIRCALALALVDTPVIIGRDPSQYIGIEMERATQVLMVTLKTPTDALPVPQIGVRDALMDTQIADAHVRITPQGDGTYMVEQASPESSHRIFVRDSHRIWRELKEPQAIPAGTAIRLGTSFEFKLP